MSVVELVGRLIGAGCGECEATIFDRLMTDCQADVTDAAGHQPALKTWSAHEHDD